MSNKVTLILGVIILVGLVGYYLVSQNQTDSVPAQQQMQQSQPVPSQPIRGAEDMRNLKIP